MTSVNTTQKLALRNVMCVKVVMLCLDKTLTHVMVSSVCMMVRSVLLMVCDCKINTSNGT